jgi:pimeloyl-ACP methyl ester carboxylesterase
MLLHHHRAGTGPPLLLLHGIGSRWQMYEPCLPWLTPRFDVIAVDLPGFGASPEPPGDPAPGIETQVRLVSEFLRELRVERPHVVGNSMGGLIALELARRGAARSAVALSPAGFANRLEQAYGHGSLWLGVRLARRIAPHADRLLAPAALRAALVGTFVGRPRRLDPSVAAADLRALASAPWFDATLATIQPRQFRGGARLPVPVTVAWGDHDRLLAPRQLRRAAQELPGARLVTLRGCGHVPTYDDPEQVARVIITATKG